MKIKEKSIVLRLCNQDEGKRTDERRVIKVTYQESSSSSKVTQNR